MTLQLRNPDFSTAVMIADVDQRLCARPLRQDGCRASSDARTVVLHKPDGISPARFIAEIGESDRRIRHAGPRRHRRAHRHDRHRPGRAGSRRSRSAMARSPCASPRCRRSSSRNRSPRARPPSSHTPRSRRTSPTRASPCSTGPTCETLVAGLNRLGVKPDGIIAILQGIKSAGALQAELVLQ